jgi:hypothetical protein
MQRFVFSLLALLAAASVCAAPKDDVHAAFSKFLAAKTFRATVTDVKTGQQVSAMEFVAPDRYHLHPGKGPDMIIVGDNGWMNMEGRMSKMPIPVGKIITQYRNERVQRELESGMSVADAGADNVAGEAAHAYTYTVTDPVKTDVKLWISDKTGLPLQIEAQGSVMGRPTMTRVHYTDFNDPAITISAPE